MRRSRLGGEKLKEILIEERNMRRFDDLPTAAVPPLLKVKTLKVLGSATCDCEQLAQDARLGENHVIIS